MRLRSPQHDRATDVGEVIERTEGRASLHTRTVLVERIVERVKAQHPYEVPGISARPIIAGNPEYLRWTRDETDGTNS
jgi:periplasmic divalent cation tolerance protein